jgi:hypothetical protein
MRRGDESRRSRALANVVLLAAMRKDRKAAPEHHSNLASRFTMTMVL